MAGIVIVIAMFFERDQIVDFSIQFETFIADRWHPIVRYDSAHGFGHRDLMHPDGTNDN